MSQHNPANRSTADYLENIKKQGHGSVLEHAVYVLLIEGISRSCSHELVRHRAGSRSEEHTSELPSLRHHVCRLLLEKQKPLQPPPPVKETRNSHENIRPTSV